MQFAMCSNMFINSDKYLLLFGQPGVAISDQGNLQILGFLLLGSFMIQGNPSSFCVSAFYDAFRCVCPPLALLLRPPNQKVSLGWGASSRYHPGQCRLSAQWISESMCHNRNIKWYITFYLVQYWTFMDIIESCCLVPTYVKILQ